MRLFVKRVLRRWCPSPESERLLAAMEAAEIELERRKSGQDPGTETAGWLLAANRNLEKARGHLAEEEYQVAWREIKAAERTMLEDPKDGAGDRDGDGYSNVEEYLNSLVPPGSYGL